MTKKTADAKKQPRLTKKQEEAFNYVLGAIGDAIDRLDAIAPMPTREMSLAVTRLEEAEMWMLRGFEKLGYEPEDLEDEGDEDGDEGEEPEEEDGEDEDDE